MKRNDILKTMEIMKVDFSIQRSLKDTDIEYAKKCRAEKTRVRILIRELVKNCKDYEHNYRALKRTKLNPARHLTYEKIEEKLRKKGIDLRKSLRIYAKDPDMSKEVSWNQ